MSLVALILAIVAAVLPWWAMTASVSVPQTITISVTFDFGQVCVSGAPFVSGCAPYGTDFGGFTLMPRSVGDAFGPPGVLMLLGVLLSILQFVFVLLGVFYPKLGLGAFALGIPAALLILVAPIYLLLALPPAIRTVTGFESVAGFFGSVPQAGGTLSYGGGAGWFLAFAAAGLLLIGSVLSAAAVRRLAPLGNIRIAPAAAYPGPYVPVAYPQNPYAAGGYQAYPYQAPLPAPFDPGTAPPSGPYATPPREAQYGAPVGPYPGHPPSEVPIPTQSLPEVPSRWRYCARCGAPRSPDAAVCAQCGTTFL